MINLIKAEIDYYKYRILTLFWIIPAFYLYAMIRDSDSWFVLPCIMSVAIAIQILIDRNIEKREHLHVILPISVRRIAMTRLLTLLMFCVSLYGVYLIIHLLVTRSLPPWNDGGFDLIMFFGLSLLGFSMYFVQRDLLSAIFRADARSGIDAIILIVLCATIIYGVPIGLTIHYKTKIDTAKPVIAILFICSILLLYPSVVTFAQRKSYLE